MPALEKNHIYRSTIEGYSSEGLGVARIDGQVVDVSEEPRFRAAHAREAQASSVGTRA